MYNNTSFLRVDRNTKYFQMVANGKYRKTRIFQLDQKDGIIRGYDNL
jgi:hypothetical protein